MRKKNPLILLVLCAALVSGLAWTGCMVEDDDDGETTVVREPVPAPPPPVVEEEDDDINIDLDDEEVDLPDPPDIEVEVGEEEPPGKAKGQDDPPAGV
ncbi:MAG TPA: hypothetical protein VF150_06755 [Thermoanaerobaculia bacterium]